ncbi:MAG: hypothetical protein AB4426_02820 [Xenococcaceae cyanobacterium]
MKLTQARLLTGLLMSASVALFSTAAVAEETTQTPDCYMIDGSGQVIDLSRMCNSSFNLEQLTTTSKELTGVQARDAQEWPWGIGGQYLNSDIESNYEVKREGLFNQAKIEKLNLTLDGVGDNVGDTNRITRRLQLIPF